MSKLVFKILKPSVTFHGLDYNEKKVKKGHAGLLHFDNFGLLQNESKAPSKKEMKVYMDWVSSANKRIRNKQFHAILSCKGKMYSLKELKSYALQITNELGYTNNPIAIYGHNDTKHHHVHIITTRIGIDGKKIPHHFEGKRAGEIVSQILETDKKALFSMDLNHALSYSFSTMAQFQLLMEQKGYAVKKHTTDLKFFKYGTQQGSLPLDDIEKKLNKTLAPDMQIRAVIHKYKSMYSTSPIASENENYSTKKQPYQSALTNFLHKNFGWEFVFFKNSKHDQPYGYVLINHNKKKVYKGSEVLSLKKLLAPSAEPANEKGTYITAEKEPFNNQSESVFRKDQLSDSTNLYIPDPLDMIDRIIEQTEMDAEQEQHSAYDPKKRKGRFL